MLAGDFALFDLSVYRRSRGRGRGWGWSVVDRYGNPVLTGSERSRTAAQYVAARVVFQLLLTAPYRNIRLGDREGKQLSAVETTTGLSRRRLRPH